MCVLENTNRLPPYIHTTIRRCKKLGRTTRRNKENCMMALNVLSGRISDKNIDEKLIVPLSNHSLRDNRLLLETFYSRDYSYNQPIAKAIRNVNKLSDLMALIRR